MLAYRLAVPGRQIATSAGALAAVRDYTALCRGCPRGKAVGGYICQSP